MIEVYVRSTCSSCKKAEADVRASGQTFQIRDFFKEPLNADEIGTLLTRAGVSPADALATRSVPYKELDLANRELTDAEILDLMAEHPALMRRPIVLRGDHGLIGYNQQAMAELIAG
jgi:arsenate reductase